MKMYLLNCREERQLGAELAEAANAPKTADAFKDVNSNAETIVKTAIAELSERGGMDTLVSNALKGPPKWAAAVLHYAPKLGSLRGQLLDRVGQDPNAASYALRHVSDIGNHRDMLLSKAAEDPGSAHMILHEGSDVGKHRKALLAAAVAPPVERGSGYNTYFVNQTGSTLWLRWNTGERGSTGSLSDPVYLLIDQNTGWGRGGACISELRVFKTQQDADAWGPSWGSWNPTPIDGCLSWGFVLKLQGASVAITAEAWAEGQPGLPGKYPPSYGHQ